MPPRPCAADGGASRPRTPRRATRFPCGWASGGSITPAALAPVIPRFAPLVENSLTRHSDFSAQGPIPRAMFRDGKIGMSLFLPATPKGVDASGANETDSVAPPVNVQAAL